MKKNKFGRDDNFVTLESLIFSLASLITVRVFGIIYLLLFILVFLCSLALKKMVDARIKELKKNSERPMQYLIADLILLNA